MSEIEKLILVYFSFENKNFFFSGLNFFYNINNGCLAMGKGTTEKISEFQVGIDPLPPYHQLDALTTELREHPVS